jgi:hypothetical protein
LVTAKPSIQVIAPNADDLGSYAKKWQPAPHSPFADCAWLNANQRPRSFVAEERSGVFCVSGYVIHSERGQSYQFCSWLFTSQTSRCGNKTQWNGNKKQLPPGKAQGGKNK